MEIFMIIIFAICFLGVLFSFAMLARNDIVFNATMKAIGIASDYANEYIHKVHGANRDWDRFYEIYESYHDYDRMMWKLTAWRFEDFYPNYENRMKQVMDEIYSSKVSEENNFSTKEEK